MNQHEKAHEQPGTIDVVPYSKSRTTQSLACLHILMIVSDQGSCSLWQDLGISNNVFNAIPNVSKEPKNDLHYTHLAFYAFYAHPNLFYCYFLLFIHLLDFFMTFSVFLDLLIFTHFKSEEKRFLS